MGHMIWSDCGRLLALTTGTWTVWGGLWALSHRKYFWDFVGSELGPAGTIPSRDAAPFIALIVTTPVVQGICIVNGLLTILFEWPVFPGTFLYRSLMFKAAFYSTTVVFCSLLYQTADAAMLYLVTVLVYAVALRKGEILEDSVWNPC